MSRWKFTHTNPFYTPLDRLSVRNHNFSKCKGIWVHTINKLFCANKMAKSPSYTPTPSSSSWKRIWSWQVMHRDKMVFKRLAESFKLNILFDYDFMQLQVGVIMPEPFNPSAAGTLPKQLRLLTWPWSSEYIQQFYTPSYCGNGYLHPQSRERQL